MEDLGVDCSRAGCPSKQHLCMVRQEEQARANEP